jgi:glycosyltransferase involved in cell wall biosynthesis
MPKVSVLLPVYNAEKYLEKAILSVLSQSFRNFELICFDDGSTDRSSGILERLASTDDRMTVLSHPRNRGVGQARNTCLEQARGKYFLFVDADDFIEPDAIKHCVETAEACGADIVSFGLNVKAAHDTKFGNRPQTLNPRSCYGLWDTAFKYRDVPESIFQLGIGLNNAFFRSDFIRKIELKFENQRVGEWISFITLALAQANRITLVNKVLYHVNWWHGTNLTQNTQYSPKRYYQSLLNLKEKLEELDLYQELERSYVNYTAEMVILELVAEKGRPTYTNTAQFYRVYGFDALGIIGFPKQYYYDPDVHPRLRQIILGDVLNDQERLIIDLKTENKQLRAENKKLTSWKGSLSYQLNQGEQQGKLGWRLAGKASRAFRSAFSSKSVDNSKGFDAEKRFEKHDKHKMNASTGYRLTKLCDYLLELNPKILMEYRRELATSLLSHKKEIRPCMVYGEWGISTSNKIYLSFLDRLLLLMQSDTSDAQSLTTGLKNIRDLALSRTEPTLKFVFNLEKQQVFPALESTFSASRNDNRIESTLVFAPLGMGRHGWNNSDAPLFDKDGIVAVRKKHEYNMFKENPDVLITARPYLNSAEKPYGHSKYDRFEIQPAAVSGYRTVYLPYAFFDTISAFSMKYGYQYTLHPLAWKIAAYSEQILGNFRKYSQLEGKNAVLLGAPRYDVSSGIVGFRRDELTEKYEALIHGRRTLFWNSHFRTAKGNGQQLVDYLKNVLKYFMEHPDLVLFWRPHPMMFAALIEQDVLLQREVDDLLDQIDGFENIIFDESKDYINAFALSDAMLTDGDSSLPYEYIATGKPVYIYYIYGGSEGAMAKKYKNHIPLLYYRDYSNVELLKRLNAFAQGDDPLKDERLKKAAHFIHNNDGRAGERFKDYIVEELFRDEESVAREIVYSGSNRLGMKNGLRICEKNGKEELNALTTMATPLFHEAFPGDRVVLIDKNYTYAVARYSPRDTPAENSPHGQNWLSYADYVGNDDCAVSADENDGDKDANGLILKQEPYEFSEHTYFRICAQRTDERAISWQDTAIDVVRFDALSRPTSSHSDMAKKKWLTTEVDRVSRKVKELKQPGELAFALFSDARYAVNGTWDDTVCALRSVHENAKLNSTICLGDFTNGMLTIEAAREYVGAMQKDLETMGIPLRITLGECDSNSLSDNANSLSIHEQSQLYLGKQQSHYHVDIPNGHLRLIFLDSYDYSEEQPFGYSDDCVKWLRCTLSEMPRARKAIIFSHIPPLSRLQHDTETLRGEQELMNVLGEYAHQIMAFISGHNRADNLDNEEAFPIVSIAGATCEHLCESVPDGFIVPERVPNEVTQECWDIMLVNPVDETIRFIRFGAGRDRMIEGGCARWV